jgi:pyruvate formate lyase activating enzyme
MNMLTNDIEGVVLRIERSSIHDGSGLRTVVFLKGCPLSCRWCSTPESQNIALEKGYISDRCVGCSTCIAHCPADAISLCGNKIKVDQSRCNNSFACVAACPEEAYKVYGRFMTVDQVVAEISKDEIFFFHSGGGVTISGGECLLQPEFTAGILRGSQQRGIDTAVETSLYAPWRHVKIILPFVNTLYVDIKHPDRKAHKQLVGVENDIILDNLKKLDASGLSFGLHLRIPLVPGVNDADDTLLASIAIATKLKKLREIEILPYHRLGVETYAHLGWKYQLNHVASPSQEYIIERTEFLRSLDLPVPVKVGGGYV